MFNLALHIPVHLLMQTPLELLFLLLHPFLMPEVIVTLSLLLLGSFLAHILKYVVLL